MRFNVEQRIVGSPEVVAAALVEPDYYGSLDGLSKIGAPEVLDRRVDGSTVTLRIRYRFAGDLSAAARAVLDPAKLTWVEESIHQLDRQTATFRLLPDNYGDRFRCTGAFQLVPSGDDGTTRRVQGDLTVRTPLMGRVVEQAIVSGLREHLDDEVPQLERWILATH